MFVQIVNLLNLDYPPAIGLRLCQEVLATLGSLLRGCEANRQRLRTHVGYDTLASVVLTRGGAAGPSQGILEQVLCLALEVGATLLRVWT